MLLSNHYISFPKPLRGTRESDTLVAAYLWLVYQVTTFRSLQTKSNTNTLVQGHTVWKRTYFLYFNTAIMTAGCLPSGSSELILSDSFRTLCLPIENKYLRNLYLSRCSGSLDSLPQPPACSAKPWARSKTVTKISPIHELNGPTDWNQ